MSIGVQGRWRPRERTSSPCSGASSKFALNAISGAGAVGILFLGGWLVLNGHSDVGTVMASLTGLTRIDGPWRELVGFFRNASTVRVKYAMLVRALTHREGTDGSEAGRHTPGETSNG